MELSDEAAVERCLKGDRNAFSLLVEKYQNAVYGLCYHIVGNFADAQDLTQEAFVRAYLDLAKIVDLKFKADLDNRDIPEELRQEFGKNGFPLSSNIRFVAQRRKGEWLIEDGEKPYYIKESAYSLHVYTLQHKEWSIRDEDNGREYFVTKVVDGLDFYSIPAH